MKANTTQQRHPMKVTLLGILSLMAAHIVFAANGELWEYTLTFDMPGMTMPIGSGKICRAEDGAKKPNLPKNCKLDQYSVSGNTSTFHAVCGPPQPSIMSGEVTRSGDQVNGIFKVKGDGGEITMVQKAHKLGSCSNPVQE